MSAWIKDDVAHLQRRSRLHFLAPSESAQPREKDLERKRFGQVVVGACIETGHDVLGRITSGEQENRAGAFRGAETTDNIESIETGKHNIEHQDVKMGLARGFQSFEPVEGECNRLALLLQPLLQL